MKTLSLWPFDCTEKDSADYPFEHYSEQQWGMDEEGGICVKQVTEPTLTMHFPEQPNGTAMLICPGGGYQMLCLHREGHAVAQRFNQDGITCAVLKYRHFDKDRAWMDAQRAIRLMRHHADEWGINKDEIGIGGFSAGGHLSAHATCRLDESNKPRVDEADQCSSRPNFMCLIYAPLRAGERSWLDERCVVNAQTPPAFLVHGVNDGMVDVVNSLRFYDELLAAAVPAEMHIYQDGVHGFDQGRPGTAHALWTDLFVHWLRTNALMD